ncbi:DUF1570 domain-containing protein [Planctomycetales bacterium ZRK34]|nr:DUF1570 domain-containing protein [Planctomycetales bacterium ZRK34]
MISRRVNIQVIGLLLIVGATAPAQRMSPQAQNLAKEFGEGTYLRMTPHYLLVYDTPHAWADSRVELLERAHDAFYSVMNAAGFDPAPIDGRLIGVLFNKHRDYLAYGHKHDGIDVSSAGGYYSPRSNRIAMFNTQSSPQLAKHRKQIAQLQRQIDQATQRADAAGEAGDMTRAAHYRQIKLRAINQVSLLRNQMQRGAGLNNISQTIHEATHQLAFNSGIQSRYVNNPFWLSEGLATNFETMSPAVPFGPGQDNLVRRRALLKAAKAGQLDPLSKFVGRVQLEGAVKDDQRERLYAQAWGLFSFLFETRRDALREYMQQVAAGQGGSNSEQLIANFEKHFGTLKSVGDGFRQWISRLN